MIVPADLRRPEDRYRVSRLLGEGSRKRVNLARDTWLDRDVALATVDIRSLSPGQRARVTQEAQTLAHLGDHPHVVTVHDFGESDGQLYLVTEYLPGGTLEERLREAGGEGLPLEVVWRVAAHLAAALAHVHAAGVVHRDVKPANVWLTASGVAKLGDFGLATARDGVRLTEEGLVVGTVAYMAPEQAVGGVVEPRSDLYALGVLLYELVTGRLPFAGEDAVAVVHQHLHAAPVAPSWHRAEVPPRLEGLILRLLAKSPQERPEAVDVCAALDGIDDKTTVALVDGAGRRNPLDRLAGGVFVGRETELGQLRAAFEEARAGRGRLVVIGGDPGIGKTRLLDEVTTYARIRRARVVRGRCYETGGAPPLWPWVQVLRTLVAEQERDALRAFLGVAAKDVARLVPAVRERLPEVPDPMPASDQDRFRLFDGVAMFLRALAAESPLLIVLDDLHGADVPSLMLLAFLARELAEARVLLVAAYRDGEVDAAHPLTAVLREAARAPSTVPVALGGLSELEVGRLIAHTVGVVPADALVRAVSKETEGNPLFVVEVVRLLVAENRLQTPGARLSIPATVRTVIEQRLARLAPQTLEALRVAAVMGREFDQRVLTGVMGGAPVEEAMAEAVAARVFSSAAPGRCRFGHALMRETLYDGLTAARRMELHEAIAIVLESDPDVRLSELALHLAEAGPEHAGKAIASARRAGDQAVALLAFEEGARLYQLALDGIARRRPADDSLHGALLLALADAQRKSGAGPEARRSYEAAAAVARRSGDVELLARAAVGVGEVGYMPDVLDAPAIALTEAALTALGDVRGPLRLIVQATLAWWLRYVDPQRSYSLARDAVVRARQLDPATLGFALRHCHYVLWGPDVEPRERLSLSIEIQRLGTETGDRELMAEGLFRKLMDLLELGDLYTLEAELQVYERLASELRSPLHQAYAGLVSTLVALFRGRLLQVLEWLERTAASFERTLPAARAQYLGNLFTVQMARGLLAEAEATVAHGRAEMPLAEANWRAGLAYVYVSSNRSDEARREFDALMDDFTRIPRGFNWIPSTCVLAMVCGALGDRGRAATLYGLLRPHAGRNACAGIPASTLGPVSRYVGVLATTLGKYDEAVEHYDDALARNRLMDARPWLAFTQHDYAAMLLERAAAGDAERALELLDESVRIATELDMRVLLEQSRRLRDRAAPVPDGETAVAGAADRGERYAHLKSTQELRRAELLAQRLRSSTRTDAFPDLLGNDPALREVLHLMDAAAGSSMAVLVEGETGTGKELVARGIHRASRRAGGPFLAVNCAAIPDHLLESELFGHRRGAFTGATAERVGHFEAASGGTLLLDEIGEMPPAMQAKLLRVLQEGEVLRLGESRPRPADVRVISATNRDLAAQVAADRFREDLYYRLTAFPIRMPPLRERRDDIPLLVEHFVRVAAAEQGKPVPPVTTAALVRLVRYEWPGNVRELQNVVQRAVALVRAGEPIDVRHLSGPVRSGGDVPTPVPPALIAEATSIGGALRAAPQEGGPPAPPAAEGAAGDGSLRGARDTFEARYIADVLRDQGGNVSRAAIALGLSRAMLHRKLKKYGIH